MNTQQIEKIVREQIKRKNLNWRSLGYKSYQHFFSQLVRVATRAAEEKLAAQVDKTKPKNRRSFKARMASFKK